MGSKKYKGERCAYCAEAVAQTGDHVFCREFFPVGYRGNLPKAPACAECNHKKSKLEHYLTAVLPFGSDHPAALAGQEDALRRRLEKNPRLRDELSGGSRLVWARTPTGLMVPSRGLPFDGTKFVEYLKLAVRGLVWHESHCVVPSDYVVEVFTLGPDAFELFCSTVMRLGSRDRATKSYESGALRYTTACSPEDRALSTWQLWLYENLAISSALNDGESHRLEAVGLTGPPSIRGAVDRILESNDNA